jgi:hypothetical protein
MIHRTLGYASAVPALRLPLAAALVAAMLPALFGASCDGPAIPYCNIPSPSETSPDGAPDPCHCDPPPSLNIAACPCLSGSPGDVDIYKACMATYQVEIMDAGAGG